MSQRSIEKRVKATLARGALHSSLPHSASEINGHVSMHGLSQRIWASRNTKASFGILTMASLEE
jgi:hypothetical protein